MSYEDLEDARAKRAEKEAATAAKGKSKRGRKRKSSAPEAEEATADKGKRSRKRKRPSTEPEAPEPTAKVARISKVQVVEDQTVPKPWRAPVARMY
jgi:sRNA-binding protein